ncbi:tyrosine protein kinase, putative [Entamoeba invadens IP1]|uniref:tyrosine protein kinase, putative n=1 Tax=Entamoeba invadens IP1 TaxID=370355 RepID=UPI0002C3DB1F|nr:tyrosine protein kinase, putative [Entamoeba invadens IP1]ELP90595.1 tyrosine protein kinase, putative [Entamoeba invadens IP1]|eukprot:XP_004257366.1 tyrosine protein kinase, putative [Entamoeba invadens IP1]
MKNLFFKHKQTIANLYFEKVSNWLTECPDIQDISTDKLSLHLTETKDSSDISVCQPTKAKIIVANAGKKTTQISFEKNMKSSSRFSFRSEPSTLKLRPNEAFEFTLEFTPLCTCKVSEAIFLVTTTKKLVQKQPVKVEFQSKKSLSVDYQDIDEKEFLGINEFKDFVWRGKFRGCDVVVDNRSDESKVLFEREIGILKTLNYQYINYFVGACHIPHHECILTEDNGIGTLKDVIQLHAMPELSVRVKLCLDIAKGLNFIHKNNVIHRDIKPENINVISLLDKMEVNAKISGFSKARTYQAFKSCDNFSEEVGTPLYMSPELANHKNYSTATDIFSFGITMVQILTWDLSVNANGSRKLLKEEQFENSFVPSQLTRVILGCLKKDQKQRVTIDTILLSLRENNHTIL